MDAPLNQADLRSLLPRTPLAHIQSDSPEPDVPNFTMVGERAQGRVSSGQIP
jgi:hypothetical protein